MGRWAKISPRDEVGAGIVASYAGANCDNPYSSAQEIIDTTENGNVVVRVEALSVREIWEDSHVDLLRSPECEKSTTSLSSPKKQLVSKDANP